MAKIQIIVGSVNGTALRSATAIAHVLNHQGHHVQTNTTPRRQDLIQDNEEALLVCCSTTGEGELPRQIYPLYLALEEQTLDLSGRSYGVIAFGDSGYQHFARAGYMLENALYMSGARRIGDVYTLDAKKETNQPLAAAQWANTWVTGLG